MPNGELLQELKKRGAQVLQVPVYRWALPNDTRPLEQAIQRLIGGDCQVALFTNAMQVSHLFQVATQMEFADPLRDALSDVVVGSVGPLCSQALRERASSSIWSRNTQRWGNWLPKLPNRRTAIAGSEVIRQRRLTRRGLVRKPPVRQRAGTSWNRAPSCGPAGVCRLGSHRSG